MKRALVAMVVVLTLGFTLAPMVLAGPFVGFDLTIPTTGDLTMGFKDDGLSMALTVDDVFVAPALGFEATYESYFDWWDSEFGLDIAAIDFATSYPIPVIDGITTSWLGTLHLGYLLAQGVQSGSITPYTFDLYGGVDFDYDGVLHTLTPTGKVGFYWEL